ncbi:protein C2-DOMAIN ABA-RELATED 7-like [Solanum stenotomum]|uniref:protein C2-DOMAIN ABA-RELATED 7-like n=1 Tax=Solanum stenotomum TaxID=172797 RepID=UPI0020D013CE|nr:protein C2-DOMAIN ABA-RELATED 7-like [Solanum stenotomum]
MLGLVKIRVHRGINLPLKDTFHSDPYVVVTMGDQKVKTSCKKNNCNPVWDDELTLALKYPNVQIVLTVYDKDTFSKDDKIGEAKIDIKPYLKALEMSYHQDLPNGVKVDKVQQNRDNCLAKESCIIWENGKLIQDMTLILQNVECGEVKLQIEVIPKMLSEDAFYIA